MSAAATLSSAWLETAQRAVNADPAFRKRGSIDTRMAVKVDKSAYLVTFSAFTCHSVRAIDERDLRDADFTIEMTAAVWDRFVAGRREGHGRTLAELDTTDAHRQSREPAQETGFPALPYVVAGVLRRRRARRRRHTCRLIARCRSMPIDAAPVAASLTVMRGSTIRRRQSSASIATAAIRTGSSGGSRITRPTTQRRQSSIRSTRSWSMIRCARVAAPIPIDCCAG